MQQCFGVMVRRTSSLAHEVLHLLHGPLSAMPSAGITVVGILDSQGLFLKSATSFTSVLSAGLGEQCDSEVSSPSLGSVWHRDIQDDQRIRGTLWDGLGISV